MFDVCITVCIMMIVVIKIIININQVVVAMVADDWHGMAWVTPSIVDDTIQLQTFHLCIPPNSVSCCFRCIIDQLFIRGQLGTFHSIPRILMYSLFDRFYIIYYYKYTTILYLLYSYANFIYYLLNSTKSFFFRVCMVHKHLQ